ncbi:unnamed protein product [Ixodes pacificus]
MSFSILRTSTTPSRQKSRLAGQIYAHPQHDPSSIRTTFFYYLNVSFQRPEISHFSDRRLSWKRQQNASLPPVVHKESSPPPPTDFIPSSIVFSMVIMEKEQDENRDATVLSKNRFAWPVAATTAAPAASARSQVGWQPGAQHGVRDEPERMHRRQIWVQAILTRRSDSDNEFNPRGTGKKMSLWIYLSAC